jgi:hypothetical protein
MTVSYRLIFCTTKVLFYFPVSYHTHPQMEGLFLSLFLCIVETSLPLSVSVGQFFQIAFRRTKCCQPSPFLTTVVIKLPVLLWATLNRWSRRLCNVVSFNSVWWLITAISLLYWWRHGEDISQFVPTIPVLFYNSTAGNDKSWIFLWS